LLVHFLELAIYQKKKTKSKHEEEKKIPIGILHPYRDFSVLVLAAACGDKPDQAECSESECPWLWRGC
jgi:hypothetical protein